MNRGSMRPTGFAVWAGRVIGVLAVVIVILGMTVAVKLLLEVLFS